MATMGACPPVAREDSAPTNVFVVGATRLARRTPEAYGRTSSRPPWQTLAAAKMKARSRLNSSDASSKASAPPSFTALSMNSRSEKKSCLTCSVAYCKTSPKPRQNSAAASIKDLSPLRATEASSNASAPICCTASRTKSRSANSSSLTAVGTCQSTSPGEQNSATSKMKSRSVLNCCDACAKTAGPISCAAPRRNSRSLLNSSEACSSARPPLSRMALQITSGSARISAGALAKACQSCETNVAQSEWSITNAMLLLLPFDCPGEAPTMSSAHASTSQKSDAIAGDTIRGTRREALAPATGRLWQAA
mmetsp:Transcript_118884/g.341461  ORF Transcript_118884/g.341461 Transcript_118884/m.341461 type:complete len:308 (+) Transcript_118884:1621-2544(+)